MTAERENEITVIVGRKGSGKSTTARGIMRGRPRRIIHDPMWEHTDGVIVRSFRDLVAYVGPLRLHRYAAVLRTLDDADRDRAVMLATAGTPEDPPLPGCTLLLDEVDRMCSPRSIPAGLHSLVNYGRHFRVSLVALARRPRAMHRDITANADRIIVGQTQEPADVDYLAEFIGDRLAARAKRLRAREFVTWPDDLDSPEPEDLEPARAPRFDAASSDVESSDVARSSSAAVDSPARAADVTVPPLP